MILFLDFDGVLHPHPTGTRNDVPVFCRVELLWQILEACPEVRVVFSTSWRDSYGFDYLVDFATHGGGEHFADRFLGVTPNMESVGRYARRDREIQGWLDAANYSGGWLALDDSVEFFNGGHPNLYLTNGDVGLTEKDVAAIGKKIQFLSAPVLDTSLDDGYKAMAADKAREAEAQDWCNALAKDMADEAR